MKTIVDYASKVKEQHALNKTLAPVETDLTSASQAYAVGQKFIYDGVLYQAKTAIAQGAALVLNTNYEAADDVSTEIEALTNKLNNEIATRAMLSAHNLFGVGNSLDEWFAATNDGKLPTSYLASETITGTVDKDTNSIVITAYNNTGYRWGCKKINLKKNTSYIFSRTSCDGTIQLFGKNNADDRAVVISGLSNGGTVNSGDYDWWYVGFYPTRSGGYFSITDLLVNLETDADTTFQPYAKTNQELTAENQTLTNNVQARAELSAYNLLNIFNSEINTNGTYTEVINDDGTVTIGGTPTSACTIPYKATAKYNGSVYNLKPNKDYVLDSGLSAISPLNLQVFVKENSDSSWAKIAETTTNTKLLFTTPASFYDIWVRILVPANAVVTASTIVKPMIILSSDVTIGYVPYAMTNKELTDKISNLGIKTKLITIQSTEASDSYNPVTIADELVVTNAAEIVYVYVASNGNVTNKNRYCPVGYALYEIRHVADVVTINVVAYLSSDSNSIYTIGRTRNGSWGTWFKTTMTAIS